MAKTKTDKLPYTPSELEAELVRLKPLLGRLKTNSQIKAACLERELIDFEFAKDRLKNDAFWEYLRRLSPKSKPGHRKIWDEVTLHDRIGATSQDLVDGQELDTNTFVGLGRAVDIWKRLDGDRGLSLLIDTDELSAAKAQLEAGRLTGAEFFRIFLTQEKGKHGFTQWNVDRMYDLRCRLHACMRKMEGLQAEQQRQKDSPLLNQTFMAADTQFDVQPPVLTTLTDKPATPITDTAKNNDVSAKITTLADLSRLAEDLRGRAAKRAAENLRFQNAQLLTSSTTRDPKLGSGTVASQVTKAKSATTLTASAAAKSQGPSTSIDKFTTRTNVKVAVEAEVLASFTQNTICISSSSVSTSNMSPKSYVDPYFTAMDNIQKKLKDAEERLASGEKTAVASLAKVEEAKSRHGALVERVSNQNKNLWMLCYAIKDDWAVSSIEAAATACLKYGEIGAAILEVFEPIIAQQKTLKAVHEAEMECEKLRKTYKNTKDVAELVIEEQDD